MEQNRRLKPNSVASPELTSNSVLPVSGTAEGVSQADIVMVLLSKVTAPFNANTRPSTVALVFSVIDSKAIRSR